MKRSVGLWQLMGFAVTSLCGTLLHFLYDWLGESVLVAPFSGVNESTWEHMKLLFWPMLIYTVAEAFFFKNYDGYACIKLRGILIGLGLIPLLFYGYNGIIGKSPDWINIAIFFISAAAAFIYEARTLKQDKIVCPSPSIAYGVLSFIAILFVVFTFLTPRLAIFKDPITATYGIT